LEINQGYTTIHGQPIIEIQFVSFMPKGLKFTTFQQGLLTTFMLWHNSTSMPSFNI